MGSAAAKPRVLVVDVGGTHIKMKATGQEEVRTHPSGPDLTPQELVDTVSRQTSDWEHDVVSLGYPGPVLGGRPACEPRNLGDGWVGFEFAAAFGRPVKLVNDAAMQALGSYEGGRRTPVSATTPTHSSVASGCGRMTESARSLRPPRALAWPAAIVIPRRLRTGRAG